MEFLLDVLPYFVGLALAATLGVLILGVVTMLRGGEFNAKYGNKLMRARVTLQAVAVLLLFALFLLTGP
jgi:hypothetical protein